MAIDPSYSKRDKDAILKHLKSLIPTLTDKWTSQNKADIGNVILELMATLGDMQSLHLDEQALEAFLVKSRQRHNVRSHLKPYMYKIKPAVSSRHNQTFELAHDKNVLIPRHFPVGTEERRGRRIEFYTTESALIAPIEENGEYLTNKVKVEVMEGISRELSKTGDDIQEHTNRIYLGVSDVAYKSLYLVINGEPWMEYDDVVLTDFAKMEDEGASDEELRGFSVDFDRNEEAYIVLRPRWEAYVDDLTNITIEIRYLESTGAVVGSDRVLYLLDSLYDEEGFNVTDIVETYNEETSVGAEPPEGLEEATVNAINLAMTMGLNVTLPDYKSFCDAYAGVGRSVAYDWTSLWLAKPSDPEDPGDYWEDELVPVDDYLMYKPFKIYIPIALRAEKDYEEPPKPTDDFLNEIGKELDDIRVSYQQLFLRVDPDSLPEGQDEDEWGRKAGDPWVLYYPIEMSVRVTVPGDYTERGKQEVETALRRNLLGYFEPQNHEFGQPIPLPSLNRVVVEAHEDILHAFITVPKCTKEMIFMPSPYHFPYLKEVAVDIVEDVRRRPRHFMSVQRQPKYHR